MIRATLARNAAIPLLLACAGCAPGQSASTPPGAAHEPASAARSAQGRPAAPGRVVETPPPVSPPPSVAAPTGSLQRLCRSGPAGTFHAGVKKILFEFDDIVLHAEPVLPPAPRAPFPAGPRTLKSLVKPITDLEPRLKACYRHLRWTRPALEGIVSVEGVVDPFGDLRDLKVTAQPAAAGPLVLCVERALATLRYAAVTPRETHLMFAVQFTPSGQRRPATAPPDPDDPGRRAGPMGRPSTLPCLLALSPLPQDRPSLPTPVLTVTDLDAYEACLENARDDASKRRAACQKRYGPRAPCLQRVFTHQCQRGYGGALVTVSARPSTAELRKVLLVSAARYQACYRQALSRSPGLTGVAAFQLEFSGVGLPHQVTLDPTSTLPDPQVVTCLHRAVSDVQLPTFEGDWSVRIRLPLAFRPGRAP